MAEILLVQHDASPRKFAHEALASNGFTVLEASGGLEGISLMLCYPGTIRLAIVDIIMPGVNGLDFANQLLIDRPKTAILYISALAGSVAEDSIRRTNPESILTTPFTAEELIARVRRLLAAKNATARHRRRPRNNES